MASHGALKEVAASGPQAPRKLPKELDYVRLTPAENGGVSVEHHFTHYDYKPEMHVFAAGQHKELMAHLQKHLSMSGVSTPGKSKTESAESEEQRT